MQLVCQPDLFLFLFACAWNLNTLQSIRRKGKAPVFVYVENAIYSRSVGDPVVLGPFFSSSGSRNTFGFECDYNSGFLKLLCKPEDFASLSSNLVGRSGSG
jgi:hypothetical protein